MHFGSVPETVEADARVKQRKWCGWLLLLLSAQVPQGLLGIRTRISAVATT